MLRNKLIKLGMAIMFCCLVVEADEIRFSQGIDGFASVMSNPVNMANVAAITISLGLIVVLYAALLHKD